MFVLIAKGPWVESIVTDSALPLAASASLNALRTKAIEHAALSVGTPVTPEYLADHQMAWEPSKVGGEIATTGGFTYRIAEIDLLTDETTATYKAPHCGECGGAITDDHQFVGVGTWIHVGTEGRWCLWDAQTNPDMKKMIKPVINAPVEPVPV